MIYAVLWTLFTAVFLILLEALSKARSLWVLLLLPVVLAPYFLPSPVASLRRSGVTEPVPLISIGFGGLAIAVLLFFVARWSGLTPALTRWFDRDEPAEGETGSGVL